MARTTDVSPQPSRTLPLDPLVGHAWLGHLDAFLSVAPGAEVHACQTHTPACPPPAAHHVGHHSAAGGRYRAGALGQDQVMKPRSGHWPRPLPLECARTAGILSTSLSCMFFVLSCSVYSRRVISIQDTRPRLLRFWEADSAVLAVTVTG